MMSTNKTAGTKAKAPTKWAVKPKAPAKPKEDNTPKNEPKTTGDIIGSLKGGKEVHQKLKTVRIKAMRGPISHRVLPEDIQRWLKNK